MSSSSSCTMHARLPRDGVLQARASRISHPGWSGGSASSGSAFECAAAWLGGLANPGRGNCDLGQGCVRRDSCCVEANTYGTAGSREEIPKLHGEGSLMVPSFTQSG